MITQTFATDELYNFIFRATANTYAGGGVYEKIVERPGFLEMVFQDRDWHYRDSYTGFYRSSGSEIVRYNDQVVWASSYCGGMVDGRESLANDTFNFLKKAMLAKPKEKQSFRGPDNFHEGDWEYYYRQHGDVLSFSGHEEILYKKRIIFSHDIIGLIIIGK